MRYYPIIPVVIFLSSCVETQVNFDVLRPKVDYSLEEAKDVQIIYSDSARTKISIEGPTLLRYIYRFRVEEEFPDGVHVEFYDRSGDATAWLDARYAIRKPGEKLVIARDSVVLFNHLGERIEGVELIWDEGLQEMRTDRFVKITRPDEIIYSRGFRSNQSFTDYELYLVEGDVVVEEFEKQYSDTASLRPELH